MPPVHRPSTASRLALACLVLVAGRGTALAQTSPADSVELLEELHEQQEEFELFRQSRTALQDNAAGACDVPIGRICIWFGGEQEDSFPAEFREVQQARVELIRSLFDSLEQVKDEWVMGQLVNYLVENRNPDEAARVATECGIAGTWWCSALLGYALHVQGRYVDAEAAFRDAVAAVPDAEREDWTTPRYIVSESARARFTDAAPDERERMWELFWRLSDPLFLFEGNDRLTDHWARWVVARNRRDAADPLGIPWDVDLEETLIRYGRNTGYSRTRSGPRQGLADDNRRMLGHHHPKSRGYLFPEDFLESPSDIPPESWITAPRDSREWFAPLYAPEIRGLETQVGRFRRGDAMLVVGAYRPTLPEADSGDRVMSPWGPDGPSGEAPHASLFLVPVDGQPMVNVRGRDAEGVLAIDARPGRYVSGLEVVDLEGRRAWRARQGVAQLPLDPGALDVSDLMILAEGAPLPESLDDAIPLVRAGVRLRRGETFGVVWEAYGLRVQEPVRVTIGFTRGRPGFLERVGEFLGAVEPDRDVDVAFDDPGPDLLQTAFRSVQLALPDLEPGAYTLHLRLEAAGRTPVVTSRPIVVEER